MRSQNHRLIPFCVVFVSLCLVSCAAVPTQRITSNGSADELTDELINELNTEQDNRFRYRVEKEQNVHLQSGAPPHSSEYKELLRRAKDYRRKIDSDVTENNHPELYNYLKENAEVILPLDIELILGLKKDPNGCRDPVALDAIGFGGLEASLLDLHLRQLEKKSADEEEIIKFVLSVENTLISEISYAKLAQYRSAFAGKADAFRILLITTTAEGKTYLQPRRWRLKTKEGKPVLYKGIHTAPSRVMHDNDLLNKAQAGKDFGSVIFVTSEQGEEVEKLVGQGNRTEADERVASILFAPQSQEAIHILILPKSGHTRYFGGPESANVIAVKKVIDEFNRLNVKKEGIQVFRHEGPTAFPGEFSQVSRRYESKTR